MMTILSLVISVLSIVGLCKCYMKRGYAWWSAIIPVYNVYIFFKIGMPQRVYLFFVYLGTAILGTVLTMFGVVGGVMSSMSGAAGGSMVMTVIGVIAWIAFAVIAIMGSWSFAGKFTDKSVLKLLGLIFPVVMYMVWGFGNDNVVKVVDKE